MSFEIKCIVYVLVFSRKYGMGRREGIYMLETFSTPWSHLCNIQGKGNTGGMEVQVHVFVTSARGRYEWSDPRL
jgi:hypothetical protein